MERRRFLGLLGSATLGAAAGCSSLVDGDDDEIRLDPEELAAVVSEGPPDPSRPAPVQPDPDVVDSGLDRGDDLLAGLPDSLTAETVPDEDVRRALTTLRNRAREARGEVAAAPTDFHALWTVGRFRQRARNAQTAHDALDSDLRDAIEDERTAVERAVGTALARVPYAGEDRGRTLLFALRLEESLTSAQRALARSYGDVDEEPLLLGALAGDAEYARAVTDAVDHLSERYAAAVGDSTAYTQTFDAALASAEESLTEYVRSADSPSDLVDAAADRRDVALLVDSAQVPPERLREVNEHAIRRHLALALDEALRMATEGQALAAVLSRVENGEFPPPETADRVREEREAALAAAEDVDPAGPSLAADVYVRLVRRVRRIDETLRDEVARAREGGRAAAPALPYARYAAIRAQLEALPDAVETFRGWFDRRPKP